MPPHQNMSLQTELWPASDARQPDTCQRAALGLATGSACLEIAMPLSRKILLRDAPPILWRKLQEDLNARLAKLAKP
jgi:hypothetical protein